MNINIFPMTAEDLNNLFPILSSDFDEFWSITNLKSEFENSNSECFVAKLNTEIVGFASIWKSPDDVHVTNIITKKNYRNNGIGSKLLEHLIFVAKSKNFNCITLEVNESNTIAQNLYLHYNFKRIGIRKNYYGQNGNAIIMTLKLY